MGNGCQDTFIGSKSLSVNKSRVPSVKKVPRDIEEIPSHSINTCFPSQELVLICPWTCWDLRSKKNPTVSPIWGSWKVSLFSTFKGRPKPLNRNSFSRLSTSRMDGFPPRMDVLGSDYDWCLPMVPMISDVSKTSLRNRIGLTEALINSNKLLEVSRGWFWIWHYLWWKDLQNIQQPCQ